jgi:peptidoglycan-associated lipoprotein
MSNIFYPIFTLLIFTISVSGPLHAQETVNRHIEAADIAYKNQQYQTAIEKYKKGYSKIKGKKYDLKGEISFRLGECYRLNGDFRRSRVYYYRAIRFDYATINPKVHLYYAQAMQMNENYEKAIEAFNAYLEYEPDAEIAVNGIKSCELAEKWQNNPTGYQVDNIYRINSSADDFAPAYADKFYTSIIFTSTREEATGEETDPWTGDLFSDLFYAKQDRQGRWGDVVNIDTKENVNTPANEGVPVLTANFDAMYFTRCIERKEKKAGCKIYKVTRSGMNWGKPEEIEFSKDSSDVFGHPAINEDETLLIFASDKPGSIGGKDLYYSEFEDGKFQRPVNMGDVINTSGNELFPFLKNDSVLYFSSNGHVGMGGLDIFRTVKKEGKWQQPVNMKYPLNSVGDDFGLTMQKDREEGYFSSNRRGTRGDDIFYFLNPPVEYTFRGTVTDEQTLQPVEKAEITLTNLDEETTERGITDKKGFFSFSPGQLDEETIYEIEIAKANYFQVSDTLSTIGVVTSTDFERSYNLSRIPDKPVVLPDILFETGKWDLQVQYQDSLQGLIQRLDANKNIVIELGAHTDARASEEYNDILSQKRAEAVVDYLIERGINAKRLVAKGYGERQPRELQIKITRQGITFASGTVLTEEYINDSLETQKEKELAMQLNRRIDFRVLRKDFEAETDPTKTGKKSAVALIKDPASNKVNYIPGKGTSILLPVIINGYAYNVSFSKDNGDLVISPGFAKSLLDKGMITKEDFNERALSSLKRGNIPNQALITLDEVRVGATSLREVTATVFSYFDGEIQIGPDFLKKFGSYEIDEENFQIIFKK